MLPNHLLIESDCFFTLSEAHESLGDKLNCNKRKARHSNQLKIKPQTDQHVCNILIVIECLCVQEGVCALWKICVSWLMC